MRNRMIFVHTVFSSFYMISFLPRTKVPQNALNVTAGLFFGVSKIKDMQK